MSKYYKFFQNSKCEYFPCHKVKNTDNFNCLFCFCPLYALGDKCGGNFVYLENGIKDCSNCTIPHSKNGYDYVREKLKQILDLASKNRSNK